MRHVVVSSARHAPLLENRGLRIAPWLGRYFGLPCGACRSSRLDIEPNVSPERC
ncbi:hypothetical protein A176_000240 [Myxococcus hansupus]|uniref:Uncharacterized protein n=1 Tax=Pseudomyxococcus hansupus TaxID=1297742 RepID=A0A0H4WP27_9BACT|nr:hypothetical protein A176_000240 [Myxococcus hansupus]